MKSKLLKWLVLVLLFLALGAAGGYLYRGKTGEAGQKDSSRIVIKNEGTGVSTEDKSKTNLKLDLLKDYINLIMLPKEEIGDAGAYATKMGEKISAIADETLTKKYLATGETENKEKKILDFLNFIIEGIKKDLNQN